LISTGLVFISSQNVFSKDLAVSMESQIVTVCQCILAVTASCSVYKL